MNEETQEAGGFGRFVKRSLIGGLVVLLPLTLVAAFFRWLFNFVTGLIQPLTDALRHVWEMPDYVGHALVIGIIVLLCFLAGYLVSTRAGNWAWGGIDGWLAAKLPGYRALKDLVAQVLGQGGGALRGEVCLVRAFGADTDILMIGLVTARHADGYLTVFVPFGPVPTAGFIYHVAPELVEMRPDIRVDAVMKPLFAAGIGSAEVLRRPPKSP